MAVSTLENARNHPSLALFATRASAFPWLPVRNVLVLSADGELPAALAIRRPKDLTPVLRPVAATSHHLNVASLAPRLGILFKSPITFLLEGVNYPRQCSIGQLCVDIQSCIEFDMAYTTVVTEKHYYSGPPRGQSCRSRRCSPALSGVPIPHNLAVKYPYYHTPCWPFPLEIGRLSSSRKVCLALPAELVRYCSK